jgi:hypothetical protein
MRPLGEPSTRVACNHSLKSEAPVLTRPLAQLYTTYHSSLRRHFHVCPPSQDFHFDTHHFVQRLEREGLTRAQSEGIMAAMADVVDESIRNLAQNMVSKVQQEKVRH